VNLRTRVAREGPAHARPARGRSRSRRARPVTLPARQRDRRRAARVGTESERRGQRPDLRRRAAPVAAGAAERAPPTAGPRDHNFLPRHELL